MKRKMYLKLIISALFVFVAFSSPAWGDLYWESVEETGGMPANLPKDLPEPMRQQIMSQFKDKQETVKTYLTPYASRIDTPDDITIIRFDTMTLYQMDPSTRTYIKMNMADLENSMAPMAKEMAQDTKITETDETAVINGFKCRKYTLTIMGTESAQWLSKDVPGYDEYEKISRKMTDKTPRFKKLGLSGELAGKGFPVKAVTGVMGVTTTVTLQKIEKSNLDKKLFDVPEGYTQRPFQMPLK